MGSQTLEQRRVTERLALRDPRLFEEHRSQRVLHAVSVEVRKVLGERVEGGIARLEGGGDQGLLTGVSLHAPGL